MMEAGVPGYESTTYFGVLGPAGLPRPIVEQLAADIAAVLKAEDLRARFAAAGAEPVGSAPEAFAALIRAERDKWTRLIRTAGIKVE
jgi:tripartite-type tricarboxylate transporter receptor subunit TctC